MESLHRAFDGPTSEIEDIAGLVRDKVVARHPQLGDAVGSFEVRGLLDAAVAMFGGAVSVDSESFDVDGGSLAIEEDGSFVVSVSPLTSPLRDNFTIAHELGHLFLHYLLQDPRPGGRLVFRRYGSGKLETQANRFAAAFLMPQEEFKQKRIEFNGDTQRLASHFGVSEPAVKVRMEYVR